MVFKYRVTFSQRVQDDPDQIYALYRNLETHFEQLAQLYRLEFSGSVGKVYSEIFPLETYQLTVSFAREIKQFRNAHNLLKILESAVALWGNLTECDILDIEFPEFVLSDD